MAASAMTVMGGEPWMHRLPRLDGLRARVWAVDRGLVGREGGERPAKQRGRGVGRPEGLLEIQVKRWNRAFIPGAASSWRAAAGSVTSAALARAVLQAPPTAHAAAVTCPAS